MPKLKIELIFRSALLFLVHEVRSKPYFKPGVINQPLFVIPFKSQCDGGTTKAVCKITINII